MKYVSHIDGSIEIAIFLYLFDLELWPWITFSSTASTIKSMYIKFQVSNTIEISSNFIALPLELNILGVLALQRSRWFHPIAAKVVSSLFHGWFICKEEQKEFTSPLVPLGNYWNKRIPFFLPLETCSQATHRKNAAEPLSRTRTTELL